MYDWIIEADIHRLSKAARDASTSDERRKLEGLVAVKARLLAQSSVNAQCYARTAQMEDINYLFHRQQEERSRADTSCPEARVAHEKLAQFYEHRIRSLTCGRVNISPQLPAA